MKKKYNTPHRCHVVKTRMTEEEYADFTERLKPVSYTHLKATNAVIRDIKKKIALLFDWIAEAKAELAKPQAPDLVSLDVYKRQLFEFLHVETQGTPTLDTRYHPLAG